MSKNYMCPGTKEAKAELDSLADIVNEDIAYSVWSDNGGFPMNKASNGNDSELYGYLMDVYNGDAIKATKDKVEMMGDSFKKSFRGKYDENGEPVITRDTHPLTKTFLDEFADKTITNEVKEFVGGITSASTALDRIIENGGDEQVPFHIEMMSDAIKSGKVPDIPVHFSPGNVNDTNQINTEASGAMGSFRSSMDSDGNIVSGAILISNDYFDRGKSSVISSMIHEIAHHFTMNIIYNNIGSFSDIIDSVYNEYVELYPERYAAKNKLEFIAQLMSSKQTAQEVAGIIDGYAKWYRKLGDKIIKVLNKWVNTNYDTYGKAKSKEIVDSIFDIINTNKGAVSTEEMSLAEIYQRDYEGSKMTDAVALMEETIEGMYAHEAIRKEGAKEHHKLIENIRTAIHNRIKALRRTTIDHTDADKLSALHRSMSADRQIDALGRANDKLDDFEAMVRFVDYSSKDMVKPAEWLVSVLNGNTKLSYKKLREFRSDYIDYYAAILQHVNHLKNNGFFNETNEEKFKADNGDKEAMAMRDSKKFLRDQIDIINKAFDQMESISKTMIKLAYKDILKSDAAAVGNRFIDEYLDNNTDNTETDINKFELWLGSTGNANDYALRSINNILQNARNEVARNTNEKGKDVIKAAKGMGRKLTNMLYEKDSNGKRTGYIIRDKRYGEFFRDYDAFTTGLKKDFNLGEDEHYPADPVQFKAFRKRQEEWRSKETNRRYIPEYYALFADLSMNATIVRENIQHEVTSLINKATDASGAFDLMRLDSEQYDDYLELTRQKKALANRFDDDGSPKIGDEKDISEEMRKFNEALEGKLKFEANMAEYKKARKEAADKYGGETTMNFKEWLKRNSREEYAQEFWDALDSFDKVSYGDRYKELAENRSELLKLFRRSNNLTQNVSKMPERLKSLIQSIDREMNSIRQLNPQDYNDKQDLKFSDVADIEYSNDYKAAKARAAAKGFDAQEEFMRNEHYIRIKPGGRAEYVAYSYWTYVKPSRTFITNLKLDKNKDAILEMPSMQWMELDKNSQWYNKDYNNDDDEYMQPKDPKYDSTDEYNKVMANKQLANLRKVLVETYADANSKLSYRRNASPYRMAQITGTMGDFVRARGAFGISKFYKDYLQVNNDDVGYSEHKSRVIQSPSGASLNFVPTHFIKMLEDPSTISSDAVGMAIKYWEMSENYRLFNEVVPRIEIIKEQMGLRSFDKKDAKGRIVASNVSGKESKSYEKALKAIEMNLYGKRKTNINIHIPGTRTTFSLTKILESLRNWAQWVNLAYNIPASTVGFLTGMHHSILEASVGQYYTASDFAFGFKNTLSNMHNIVLNWGSEYSNNTLMSLMEMNQVVVNTSETFGRLHLSRAQRFIRAHKWYGLFTGGDFVVKASILGAVYSDFRLVKSPISGEEKFINRNDFIREYIADKISKDSTIENTDQLRKDAENMWKLEKRSLYDAYYSEGGVAKIKEEYKKYVDKNLEDRVANLTRWLAAKADGVLSEQDKTVMHQNAWLQLITMHRGWMFQTVSNRMLRKPAYNYQTGNVDVADYRAAGGRLYTNLMKILRMKANETIAYEDELRNSVEYSEAENFAVRRVATELTMMLLYVWLAKYLASMIDWDDSWMIEFLAYIALRTSFEVRSQYNPKDVIELVKSPTAAMGPLNQAFLLWDLLEPEYNDEGYTTKFSDPVSSGPYNMYIPGTDVRMTRGMKTILKMTTFKHLIELRDPVLKMKYLDNLIMKNN